MTSIRAPYLCLNHLNFPQMVESFFTLTIEHFQKSNNWNFKLKIFSRVSKGLSNFTCDLSLHNPVIQYLLLCKIWQIFDQTIAKTIDNKNFLSEFARWKILSAFSRWNFLWSWFISTHRAGMYNFIWHCGKIGRWIFDRSRKNLELNLQVVSICKIRYSNAYPAGGFYI